MTDPTNAPIKRELIGSLELSKTHKGGKPVVDLFSTDTRLQFPVLRLFDLSALTVVGIDPNTLQEGERIHSRFWAHYTESDKVNKDGRNYRDVAYLEPVDVGSPAPAPVDLGEVLGELRAIRALLLNVVEGMALFGMSGNAPAPRLELPEQSRAHIEALLVEEIEAAAPAIEPEPAPSPSPEPTPEPEPETDQIMLPEVLLAWLNLDRDKPWFQSTGHVLYGIRQASGKKDWTWEDATSPQHWNWAREQALAYMRGAK